VPVIHNICNTVLLIHNLSKQLVVWMTWWMGIWLFRLQ